MFSSAKSDWETPQWLFDKLNERYHFTLDAAASEKNHKVRRYFTEEQNGLLQDWGAKQYFAIRPMEIWRPDYGQRSATKNPESLGLRLFC